VGILSLLLKLCVLVQSFGRLEPELQQEYSTAAPMNWPEVHAEVMHVAEHAESD
jgi:hypothetical protein